MTNAEEIKKRTRCCATRTKEKPSLFNVLYCPETDELITTTWTLVDNSIGVGYQDPKLGILVKRFYYIGDL